MKTIKLENTDKKEFTQFCLIAGALVAAQVAAFVYIVNQ